jgi:hypothetical protein
MVCLEAVFCIILKNFLRRLKPSGILCCVDWQIITIGLEEHNISFFRIQQSSRLLDPDHDRESLKSFNL